MTVNIIVGDNRETLKNIPDKSVHCCVTSPPYFGLRDYNMNNQIGLENTPDDFVQELVKVFQEVKRVLRDDGTLWLNLGDSYNNFRTQMGPAQSVHGKDKLNGKPEPKSKARGWSELKEKDLVGIPWRVAFALQSDGWYLRQDIIWEKRNPMPESVTDRCTKSHEYIFLLTKSPHYYFDHEAIKEPASGRSSGNKTHKYVDAYNNSDTEEHRTKAGLLSKSNVAYNTRNKRSVWNVATKPFKGSHFAVFPEELVEPCILAGTSEKGCCANCGSPYKRIVKTHYQHHEKWFGDKQSVRNDRGAQGTGYNEPIGSETIGWEPSCKCDADIKPCVVLDPFGGAGTTALVAKNHKRDSIICELNPEYADIARERVLGSPIFRGLFEE